MKISIVFQIHYIKQMDHCISWNKGFPSLFKYPEIHRKEGQEQPSGGTPTWYTLPLYYTFRVQTKEELRQDSIHISQNSAFSCAACHWGHKAVALVRWRARTTSKETTLQRVPCWVSQWKHQMCPGDACGSLLSTRASLLPGRMNTCLGLLGNTGLMT